ncbi:MAG: DUF3999 family protein, partial [Cyclobacteriaceae bacterium]|nr:DUF3999 family protein [Cyclobacteriaceae bacterium]
MKSKTKLLFPLLFLVQFFVEAQQSDFHYSREVENVSEEWHKIFLPDEIFGSIRKDLNDIRIFGITNAGDTIEAPYILKYDEDEIIHKEVAFGKLNTSQKDGKYYFTFEIAKSEIINEITLDFSQDNFDWRIALEGSQDQKDWYSILDDYRILSIKNKLTHYSFTKLNMPASDYQYYHLHVDSDERPDLERASIGLKEISEGSRKNYKIKSLEIHEDKKQTILDISFTRALPISKLEIDVKNKYDYYRQVSIQYLADSFETEKGYKYQYRPLISGTLTSMEKNEFSFKKTILSKLRILVVNHDNEALDYGDCVAYGYAHELVARFTAPATYFLVYGNSTARKPNYDITHFKDQIPEDLEEAKLG